MKLSQTGIRLLVSDFPKCFDFYTGKLGFEVFWGDRNGPFAAFKADGEYSCAVKPQFRRFGNRLSGTGKPL